MLTTKLLLQGTRWETPLHRQSGDGPGPLVVVLAGVHGDEPAGPLAAEPLARQALTRGTLLAIPRCNAPALAREQRLSPGTEHGNLNRNFPKHAADAPRGRMAQELWSLLTEWKPQVVVDLHEGFDYNVRNRRSVGNTVLPVPSLKARWLSRHAVEAANRLLEGQEYRFRVWSRPVVGSLARSAYDILGADAMILETTRKAPLDLRVRQHTAMVIAVLQALDMLPAAAVL